MNMKKTCIGIFLALVLLLTALSASAVPITLQKVEIEDLEVNANSATRLNLEKNQDIDVQVDFVATADADNLEIKTFITGYEYNDVSKIEADSASFSVKNGNLYSRHFKLKLPDDAERDNYKLHVLVSDRDSTPIVLSFPLKLDAARHRLVLQDLTLSPSWNVRAGESVLAKVRLENRGQKDEKDVKVTVSAQELGVKASAFLEKVETEDEEETEEMVLRLPKCAAPGTVPLRITVEFDQGHRSFTELKGALTVEKNEKCEESKAPAVNTQPAQAQPAQNTLVADAPKASGLKKALEVVLLVLVALLVVVGLIIGFSKLRDEDDD